jgi:hypothetical protein
VVITEGIALSTEAIHKPVRLLLHVVGNTCQQWLVVINERFFMVVMRNTRVYLLYSVHEEVGFIARYHLSITNSSINDR